jgi:hypothetical protein
VQAKAKQLEKILQENHPHAAVEVQFVGARELNVAARDRIKNTHTLRLSEGPIGGELGGWVGLCAIPDYLTFISTESGGLREEIFAENVRGFEGQTVINKGIMASLLPKTPPIEHVESPDFWWLNNGVTIIGSQVAAGGGRTLKIRDPQVVNGLQTSRTIHEASGTREAFVAQNSRRNLLVRVIEAADEDLATEIIKATNSQNAMSRAALRSTDPFQKVIEDYFMMHGYFYERRKNHYKSAQKPRSRIVEILEVAQAAAAIVLCEPHAARGGPLRLVTSEQTYKKIFAETIPVGGLLVCVRVVRAMDEFLKTKGLSRPEASNIRFQLARSVVAFYLHVDRPKWAAVSDISMERLTRGPIDDVYQWVLAARTRVVKGGSRADNNVMAKGSEWSLEMDRMLKQYMGKHHWPRQISFM